MSKNNQTLEVISIKQIDVSKTNPRKYFDEKDLNELTESIKQHGVFQPLLVRPIDSSLQEPWEQFELVCGERRYRAAKLAGLEEIPVNIRVLTDSEAFELQIIENLERKDVHPLDEADAFKKMLDSGKYTVADIAAKMAKTESFIVQRLKLIDLIDEVRNDFMAGYLGIGHAILIARCEEFKQLDIYKEAQPFIGTGKPEYGTISDLKETIEEDSFLLTDAKFDTTDDKLLSDTCSCTVCPKRSGANPVLFEDMAEDRCFDQVCFDEKNNAYIEKEVAKIITEGKNILILAGYAKPTDIIITICQQYNVPILRNYEDWSSYFRNDWELKTGFLVSGNDAGKTVEVYIKPNLTAAAEMETVISPSGARTPMSKEEIEITESITKIQTRADRAKELDGEKVWNEIRVIDTSEIKTIIGGLFEVEVNAVCLAMISKLSWETKSKFDLEIIKERDFTKFEYNQISRIFFLDCLPVVFGNHYSNVNNYAYTKALLHYESDKINEIIASQKEISDVRTDKADAKIKELKERLEKIKPAEEPKKQAPERQEDEVDIKNFTLDIKQFDRVDKKYALNNSYFKNRKNTYPANPFEVAMYHEQFGTLPFEYSGTDWLYDTYIEYQKRNNVYHSQYFTPPATAKRIASLADRYFIESDKSNDSTWVMDMCCGFGMLSKPIRDLGFIVRGFDFSSEMVDLYNFSQDCIAEKCNYEDDAVELYNWVVANPPYGVPKLTKFFERLHSDILAEDGKAIILLPKGFMRKEKPMALVGILEKFNIIHSEDMDEDFAHTKIKAEIVVLEKA